MGYHLGVLHVHRDLKFVAVRVVAELYSLHKALMTAAQHTADYAQGIHSAVDHADVGGGGLQCQRCAIFNIHVISKNAAVVGVHISVVKVGDDLRVGGDGTEVALARLAIEDPHGHVAVDVGVARLDGDQHRIEVEGGGEPTLT